VGLKVDEMDFADHLLDEKIDIPFIAKVTGLTKEEVEKLKRTIYHL
ncbi:36579_t:CDS:1, partial [Racocetra persica]